MRHVSYCLLAFFAAVPGVARCASDGDTIVLTNGTRIKGTITEEGPRHVSVTLRRGPSMKIPLSRVSHVVTVEGRRDIARNTSTGRAPASSRTDSIMSPCATKRAKPSRPAYETETWPQVRQLVWRGGGGRFEDASKWLEDGAPATRAPDRNTDCVVNSGRILATTSPEVRHLTVESGSVGGQFMKPLRVWGNLWVERAASISYLSFKGPKHTYFRLEDAEFPSPANGTKYSYRKGERGTQNRTRVSHKLQVCKYGSASVEFIGNFGVTDEIMIQHGTLILNGGLRWSGRADKGALEVFDGATLELQSGAFVAPFRHDNTKYVYNINVYRNGVLRAGSPERPITRDAHVMLGFTDNDVPGRSGLYTARGSELAVYSADPAKARLVITSITCRKDICDAQGRTLGDPSVAAEGGRGIVMQLGGDLHFDGVHFDYVCARGIKLADPASARRWSHVTYGEHNAGPRTRLLSSMTVDPDTYYQPRRWAEWGDTTKVAMESMAAFLEESDAYRIAVSPPAVRTQVVGGQKDPTGVGTTKNAKPVPIRYRGSVTVSISTVIASAEVRYTTDGTEPTRDSAKYSGPFALKRTARLKVKAFAPGREPSLTFSTAYIVE